MLKTISFNYLNSYINIHAETYQVCTMDLNDFSTKKYKRQNSTERIKNRALLNNALNMRAKCIQSFVDALVSAIDLIDVLDDAFP